MGCGDTGTRDTLDVGFGLCSRVMLGGGIYCRSRSGRDYTGVSSPLILGIGLQQRASVKMSVRVNPPVPSGLTE